MKRDYFIIFFTSQVVLLLNLILFKLVAVFFGEDGFALYNLARRAISVLFPLMAMGLGISLTRRIAMAQNHLELEYKRLLLNALIPVSVLLLVSLFISLIAPSYCATVLFGESSLAELTMPVLVFTSGITLSGIIQSFFRGQMRFIYASMINFVCNGIIPIFSILFFRKSIEHLYFGNGCVLVIFSLFLLVILLGRKEGQEGKLLDVDLIRSHLAYGIPRTPGDISFYMLMMVPPWWVTHVYGFQSGGQVAFACTLLNLGASAISPISYFMLPKASAMFQNGEIIELRRLVKKLIFVSCLISLIAIALIESSIEIIIRVFLGHEYLKTIDSIRIVAVGILPYSVFICLRSIIDARVQMPLNAINCIIAMFSLVIIGFLAKSLVDSPLSLVVALVGSLYILGALSLKDTFKVLKV